MEPIQGAFISNNRCLMQRTEVVRLWAFLNVRPGSQMTDRQTQRDWQSRTSELVLESRPASVTDRLPGTWAGARLSPSSVAGIPCVSEILEIQSVCSGQCPAWPWFTPRISPDASPLLSWASYLGGLLAFDCVLNSPTGPVPCGCLAWRSEGEALPTSVITQGLRHWEYVICRGPRGDAGVVWSALLVRWWPIWVISKAGLTLAQSSTPPSKCPARAFLGLHSVRLKVRKEPGGWGAEHHPAPSVFCGWCLEWHVPSLLRGTVMVFTSRAFLCLLPPESHFTCSLVKGWDFTTCSATQPPSSSPSRSEVMWPG